ncbi:hypothetical protein E0Z10_g9134 [Xylaria hypoxylon]|uniref:Uncharacterized protein n=1 Tax=Xylaria hypoxylon TaxID=37992 RepID=A0A4Z0YPX0_9PEZI|nr:hypothetical protein E0Z10_g9134 [Xylaria hypoxylon]
MSSYHPWQLANADQPTRLGDDTLEYDDDEQTKYPPSTFSFASTDPIVNRKGYAHVSPTTSRRPDRLSQADQAISLASKRNIAITTLTVVWPILVFLVYVFIVFHYLLRGQVNGIVAEHKIDAKMVFFAWLILSIFILDWLHSSLAWFEAAVILNYPSWAPSNETQLKWHLDGAWASVGGWCRAISSTYRYLVRRETTSWQGPSPLWLYLAGVFFLFSVAVPLSGLSMDQKDGLELSYRPVTILGVNETTFDLRTNAAVSGIASNNWRSGQVTTPSSPAIFYAPESTKDVSSIFFEDFAQDIYQRDLAGIKSSAQDRTLKVFSGPPVSERSYGRAWGFLSAVSCSALSLKNGMKLINATGPSNWTTPWGRSESFDANNAGLAPVFAFTGSNFGLDTTYVVASDRDILGAGTGDYIGSGTANITPPPIQGALEIVVWQSIPNGFKPDDGFKNMTANPLVTSLNDSSILGYGVRCTVESDVGYASLDAATRTYSDFVRQPADLVAGDLNTISLTLPVFQDPGVFAIQSVVFQALSTLSLGYMGPPHCDGVSDTTCSALYGANLATGGVPRISHVGDDSQYALLLQIPSITPERMTLAMYKLFGETAAAMMAMGSGNWTSSDLKGLDPANDMIPGVVPWQLVLVLLGVWAVLTTLPQLLTFSQARWSQTLEAYAVKRFGANWRDAA